MWLYKLVLFSSCIQDAFKMACPRSTPSKKKKSTEDSVSDLHLKQARNHISQSKDDIQKGAKCCCAQCKGIYAATRVPWRAELYKSSTLGGCNGPSREKCDLRNTKVVLSTREAPEALLRAMP